ncbi:DUF3761 domain-containing protein [Mycolicibacterium sphagni]|uniref:DUF3761 domain-containing protein n=1 Tax=Mycolicibacterium sphagni TaxID=1786 RepID=UPI0021F344AC|nr:DUF3761 domain-containing protein [Mycolicibacterium sphagni]MCV7176163.1 DUF3761 domain-containing protein [Mycolicibacterium sphagni]
MWFRAIVAIGAIVVAAAPGVAVATATPALKRSGGCGGGSYANSDGQCVPDPSAGGGSGSGGAPSGATAVCRDGEYSFSTHRTGTCSGHGGVSQWLTN